MKGYVFVSNSTKPSPDTAESREPVLTSNVNRPCLRAALAMGYEVFWGVNRNRPEELTCDLPVKMYDSHTYRSLFAFGDNRIAFRNLSKLLKENNVEVIHCNTPVGGLIGRLCGRVCRTKKVIYTVHGFHFYQGAPLLNRTVYKWAEQVMARWTDAIITMNREDYAAAKKLRLRKGGKVYKVHGVGIDLASFENIRGNRAAKRAELGLKDTDILCISAGDLVPRKNCGTAIKAIAKVKDPNLHYLICGVGPEEARLKKLAKALGIEDRVHFAGFRTDMKELMAAADIFLFSSLQEGLPRSLMEAMASGLPAVVSRIRGNVDLIEDGKGGILCKPRDAADFAKAIRKMAKNAPLRRRMSENNRKVIRSYDASVVQKEILSIYQQVLGAGCAR